MFHSNHGPISHRFRERQRFQSKITKFSTPQCILSPQRRGYPWNWALMQGVKKLDRWHYQMVKKFQDRFNHLDTILACDGQTDRQPSFDSKDHAYAEHRAGKNA